jgi:hypothetical protein
VGFAVVSFGAAAALAADALVVPVAARGARAVVFGSSGCAFAGRAVAVREAGRVGCSCFVLTAVFVVAATFVTFVVFAVAFVAVFVSVSSSTSTFFALPRRAGALLNAPEFGGDAGAVELVCARCARVRTILQDMLGDDNDVQVWKLKMILVLTNVAWQASSPWPGNHI